MALVTVRVLRAFMWAGAPASTGSEIDVPAGMAVELAAAGKAERIERAAAEAVEPAVVAAEEPVRRRGRRG